MIAGSICASYSPAEAQTPSTQPTRPAPVQPIQRPQPPKPVQPIERPQPPKPVHPIEPSRPQPPNAVKPRPPQHDSQYHWNHNYRPPHHVGWNQAMLFSGFFGGGHYMTVRHNIPDLRRYGFNDRTRSLYATGRWMVCSQTYYHGTCKTYRGRQGSLGSLNGRVSSIRFIGR
jgi:hypothetical protein